MQASDPDAGSSAAAPDDRGVGTLGHAAYGAFRSDATWRYRRSLRQADVIQRSTMASGAVVVPAIPGTRPRAEEVARYASSRQTMTCINTWDRHLCSRKAEARGRASQLFL